MDWNQEVRTAFALRPIDDDVVEELAQHASLAYQRALADTPDPAEAERLTRELISQWAADPAFRRRLSPPTSEDALAPAPVDRSRLAGLGQEIRHACRSLWRQPGYSTLAVVTMAVGVAATTVLFSLAYGVLLKPLPWANGDRIVRLYETRQGAASRFGPIMTNASYAAWADHHATIEGLAAWEVDPAKIDTGSGPARVPVGSTTASLFPLLGVSPMLGSTYTKADEDATTGGPVVLSYGFWQERYGGSREVLGRTLRIDGVERRIVAVMPRAFLFPDAGTRLWIPMSVRFVPNGLSMFSAIARLKPEVTAAQAAAEATARARSGPDPGMVVMAVFGSRAPVQITAVPYLEAETAGVRPAILVFLAAVGLLLLTAIANVASVQLARGLARRRELAVRIALGAGGARLVRLSIIENLVLGAAAGGSGLALVIVLHRVLPAILPPAFPRLADVGVDAPVAAFAFLVSVLASLACSLLPALQARRVSVVDALADDGQAPGGAGARTRGSRGRAAIIVAQLAIATVLLVGASLLGRSFQSLLAADRGYDPANVLTARLALPEGPKGEAPPLESTDALLARLRSVPGFTHVALANSVPLMPGGTLSSFPVLNGHTGAHVQAQAALFVVSPEYFATLGLRVVAGRPFGPTDAARSRPVAIVNRAFARKYLGDHPVGVKLWDDQPNRPGSEVVGVVDDVHQRSVTDEPAPELYRLIGQERARAQINLAIKTAGRPAAYGGTLRSVLRQYDPSIDVDSVLPLEERLSTSLAQPRLYSVLSASLAGLALLVAGVGLFGVVGYAVAQRTREIGVRAALGAAPTSIVVLVLRQGLGMAAGGLALGLVISYDAATWLGALLYGVTAHDGVSYVAVPIVLLAAAAVACLAPACRAARIDPLRALRQ